MNRYIIADTHGTPLGTAEMTTPVVYNDLDSAKRSIKTISKNNPGKEFMLFVQVGSIKSEVSHWGVSTRTLRAWIKTNGALEA
jgi:hypothetical protein